jgi:uncharacterized protein (TIGR03086 family)
MAGTTDALALLSRSVDQAGAVLTGVRPDQVDLPTPCPAWNVGHLIDHVINDLHQFVVIAKGGRADFGSTPKVDDWTGSFREGRTTLIEAWREAGDLNGTKEVPGMGLVPKRFPVDQATTEFAAHTWDLVHGSGQTPDLDPEIALASLAWARGALRTEFRSADPGAAFGPEVAIGEDAPAYDRLAAFLGRTVTELRRPTTPTRRPAQS